MDDHIIDEWLEANVEYRNIETMFNTYRADEVRPVFIHYIVREAIKRITPIVSKVDPRTRGEITIKYGLKIDPAIHSRLLC